MAQGTLTVTPTQTQPNLLARIMALLGPTPLRRREALAAYLFLLPFLFFFVVFIGRAVVMGVYMSFYDWKVLGKTQPYVGLGNYQELLSDDVWWLSLKNTAIFVALTVIGSTLVALGAALAISQAARGKSLFRAIFYAPAVLSISVMGVMWSWLLDTDYGIVNYILKIFGIPKISWLGDPNIVLGSLSLVTIWWTFGFPMLVLLAGIQNIPDQIYEAARIDGADPFQVFRLITLPLLRPALLFVTVTGVISHFQVFGQPYIMTNGGGPGRASWTVIIYLYNSAWGSSFRMGYGSAIAVALAVILITITLFQFFVLGRRPEA